MQQRAWYKYTRSVSYIPRRIVKTKEAASAREWLYTESVSLLPWNEVVAAVDEWSISTPKGYTEATGLLTAVEGQTVFVKQGTTPQSNAWIQKEIAMYDALTQEQYPYIPRLIAHNLDHTSMALEALLPANGWGWSHKWNTERTAAAIELIERLAAVKFSSTYDRLLTPLVMKTGTGWPELAQSPQHQQALADMIERHFPNDGWLISDMKRQAARSLSFNLHHQQLVHNDLRGDNLPWHQQYGMKMIDLNWFEWGDLRVDIAALLGYIHTTGYDVTKEFSHLLDVNALQWGAGGYFYRASTPIWAGADPQLRILQCQLGLSAVALAHTLR